MTLIYINNKGLYSYIVNINPDLDLEGHNFKTREDAVEAALMHVRQNHHNRANLAILKFYFLTIGVIVVLGIIILGMAIYHELFLP